MFGPKIYASCGAAGFGLSFLVGLFCGASLSLVFVRALIFGVVFAALAAGLNAVLRRFLPEIFEEAAASPGNMGTGVGSSLDVTIGDQDEVPPVYPAGGIPEADFMRNNQERTASGNGSADSADSSSALSGGEKSIADAVAGGNNVPDFSEEDVEETTREEDSTSGGEEYAGEVVFSEMVPGDGKPESPAIPVAPEGGDIPASQDGLDVLPDVADFMNTGETEEGQDFEGSSYKADSGTGLSSGGGSSFGENPGMEAETMAKAIRTVLSKE